MERIAGLHSRLQLTITGLLVALVVWGLVCAWRGRVGGGFTAGLWVAQLLIVAQGLLGLALLAATGFPGELALHVIYGAVAAGCLPAALRYNSGRSSRWEALVLVAVCGFLLAIMGRAFETAR